MTNTYNSQFEITITSNPIFDIEVSNGGKGDKGADGIGSIPSGNVGQYLTNSSYNVMVWKTVDSTEVAYGDGNVSEGLDNRYTETEVNNLLTPKMNLTGDNSNVDILTFDLTPSSTTLTEGQMRWNNTDGTLDLQHANATQQIGQELFIKVINKSGASIPNASAVYFNGRQGNRPKIELARADSQATSVVMGITTQDIADDAEGFITSFGYVRQIKTDYVGWTEGATLYVSSTIAGELTITEPSAPSHSDIVGSVGIVGGNGIGSILVKIERHKDFTDLSDVNGTPLTTEGQIPVWNEPEKVFDFNYNITNYVAKETGKSLVSDTLISSLSIPRWDDLFFPLTNAKLGANLKPDYDYTNNGLLFPQNDTSEYVWITVQLPHRWLVGSTIEPHLHYIQNANTQPVFRMEYKWTNIGDAVSGSLTTLDLNTNNLPYTSGSIHQILNGASISGVGKTISSILDIKLYRIDNVYVGDLLAKQFDIHIQVDGFGSQEEYIKT